MISWTIELTPSALRQYKKLDQTTKTRIKKALEELEKSENPLTFRNVKHLVGELKGDYRLRVGDWRILFTPTKRIENEIIHIINIYAILPRGDAYK